MKIILDAQWIIDETVFSDMLNLCGYNQIYDRYFLYSNSENKIENEYFYVQNDEDPSSKKFRISNTCMRKAIKFAIFVSELFELKFED